MKKTILSLLTCLCWALWPAQALDSPLIPGESLKKLPGTYGFTEGPCADAEGNLFFTDQPSDRIFKYSPGGSVSVFMEKAGRSNGMNFLPDGRLVACADERNQLWSITPDGKASALAFGYAGKALNGPNDVFVLPSGGMYLTDPYYKRPWWDHDAQPQDRQAVYYLGPGRAELVRVAGDLKQPNGITGTPDGKILYVADIGAGMTWRYNIDPDGSLGGKALFCRSGSDGMTIDSEGNLYLTGEGVTIYNRDGKRVARIAVPEPWTSNVCFGGKDRDILFITASAHVYSIGTRVRGVFAPGK
jgi:gluconolactonase